MVTAQVVWRHTRGDEFLARLPPARPGGGLMNQNAMYRGARNRQMVKTLYVAGNSARTEALALPQVQDLGDHRTRRCPWGVIRDSRLAT
jgi:hypothetical protein